MQAQVQKLNANGTII